ncbi:MAG TPA: siroheme synthase CysG [Rhodanobacteraceae bacterium]|nr:siroheme synthase CysG [Rhodanobacteraceae bacterium]
MAQAGGMYALATQSATVPLFPLFADLRGRAVVVVGGGVVARRKVAALIEAGADVAVVAPVLDPQLLAWVEAGRVRHQLGPFTPESLDGAWLVIAATGDVALHRRIAAEAAARRVFVNVVDDADASSFHVPARVRRGRLQVAVSTGGTAPVLARRVREKVEAELDVALTEMTDVLARERARIRRRFPQPAARRYFYARLLDGSWSDRVRAGHPDARSVFERALNSSAADPRSGRVTLVGAGPGDPGLLTLKALRALQDADVIVHDRLVGTEVLELARRDAELIDAGKRVGENHAATQARIHATLLRQACAGRYVVRLQGGDPTVFGRAGEELEFLRAHAVSCDVIPGVTAALAAAAAAGIALTDRRHAHGVTLVSARAAGDWLAPVAKPHTLAIYMGVGELERLTADLIRHGRDASTPCVLVERASLPGETRLEGSLAGITALARARKVAAPALLIVGEVAAQARRVTRAERCRDGAVAVADVA